jgi:enoyl-CoA hydratase/carnithine racemase
MAEQAIIYEKAEHIAKITLNRPHRGNAFTGEMCQQFKTALDTAKWDNDVRVVVILANGKDFCTGYDHADNSVILASEGDVVPFELRRPDTQHDVEFWSSIYHLKKPVIAGVHGEIVGCGVWMTQFCDCLVAGEDTELHNLEYSIGLNYSDLFPLMHWKLPMNIAREFAYTGYPITAETGLRYGLFNHVVPVDKVEVATMRLAHRMTRMAPYTLTMQKQIADLAHEMQGYSNIMPLAQEAINVALTFTHTDESDAYWRFGKEHTPDELMVHFHELMDSLRTADDWELDK